MVSDMIVDAACSRDPHDNVMRGWPLSRPWQAGILYSVCANRIGHGGSVGRETRQRTLVGRLG